MVKKNKQPCDAKHAQLLRFDECNATGQKREKVFFV